MSGFLTLGSLTFLRVAIVRRTGPARLLVRALDYSRAAGLDPFARQIYQHEADAVESRYRKKRA
jgi:hypothetical protein